MGVTVTAGADKTIDNKTYKTWTVKTDDAIFEVTDKNNSGRYDSGDLVKCLTGNKSMNEVQMNEAWAQTCNMSEGGMTSEEMLAYNKFQQEQQAKLAAAAPPKKKGFWGKVGNFFKGAGRVLGNLLPFAGLGLMGVGMAKSIGNDPYSGLSYTMAGTGILSMGMMMNMTKQLNQMTRELNSTSPLATTYGVGSIGTSISDGNAGSWLGSLDFSNFGTTGAGTKNSNTSADTTTETSVLNTLKEAWVNDTTGEKFCTANGKWINENSTKDTLDSDDQKIAEQIKNTPLINATLVDDSDPEHKLTSAEASRLNKMIEDYDAADGDNKYDILSKTNYNRLKNLMTGNFNVDERNMKWLKEIASNPRKAKGTRTQTES